MKCASAKKQNVLSVRRLSPSAITPSAGWLYTDTIYTLAWTGLRLSEVCALQWGDLDLAGGFVTVNRTAAYRKKHRVLIGAPKSGEARRVDCTYASLLLAAGEPMIYVKEQLGHSTIQELARK